MYLLNIWVLDVMYNPVVLEFFIVRCHFFRNLEHFLFKNTPFSMNSVV